MKTKNTFRQYLQDKKRNQILILVGIFFLSWFVLTPWLSATCDCASLFTLECLDPAISITTFVVAIFLGWYAWHRDWNTNLPKYLTVRFFWEGKIRMIGYKAWLPHESDVRNWGQSIGQQLNFGSFLNFHSYPDFKLNPATRSGSPELDSHQKELVNHYVYDVYLTKIPDALIYNAYRSVKDIPIPMDKQYIDISDAGVVIMVEPGNKRNINEESMRMPIFICNNIQTLNELCGSNKSMSYKIISTHASYDSVESSKDPITKLSFWVSDGHNSAIETYPELKHRLTEALILTMFP